jgi:DNA-binding transcriptional MerR regulator
MKKSAVARKHTSASAAGSRSAYSVSAASQLTGVQPDLIRYFHSRGVFATVTTVRTGELVLDDDAIYELRRMEHYRQRYGINRSALTFISTLLNEVSRLEAELRLRDHH